MTLIRQALAELFSGDLTTALVIVNGPEGPSFRLLDATTGEDAMTPGAVLQGLSGVAFAGVQLHRELAVATQRIDEALAQRLASLQDLTEATDGKA